MYSFVQPKCKSQPPFGIVNPLIGRHAHTLSLSSKAMPALQLNIAPPTRMLSNFCVSPNIVLYGHEIFCGAENVQMEAGNNLYVTLSNIS